MRRRSGRLWSAVLILGLATMLASCGVSKSLSSNQQPSNTTSVTPNLIHVSPLEVSISPSSAEVKAGFSQQFRAQVLGTSNTAVRWLVNGIVDGEYSLGTISSNGEYLAPLCQPPNQVTVSVESVFDSTKSANAVVAIVAAPATAGPDYYVSNNGNDAYDGSACHPWQTITKAASTVGAGSTVNVTSGIYAETINSTASGTADAHIKFLSIDQWEAKVISSAGPGQNAWTIAGAYTDIVGFDISNSGTSGNQLFKAAGAHVSFLNNRVHDMINVACYSGAGIQLGSGSAFTRVDGNYVFNIGMPPATAKATGCNQMHGIYVSSSNNTITNNITFNNGDLGIHVFGHAASNNVVANNTVFGNWRGIVVGDDTTGASANYIANNIVYANLSEGIYESGTVSNNTFTNNLIFGNSPELGFMTDPVANTVTANPRFVNYTGDSTGDYNLQPSSPAIDHGTSVGAPSTDFNGGARPQGSSWDIGAYEWNASPGHYPFF
jgi:parallel beta-helix repeat protein